ncbi:MAG: carboxypeptidase-like regulatory domain-containing protein, partial [Bacteroidota bacterium]
MKLLGVISKGSLSSRFVLFLILIFSIFSLPKLSGQENTFQGEVLNAEDNTPIPYANIKVVGLNKGTAADAEGKFTFSSSAKTEFVSVSGIGYKTDTFQIFPALQENILRLKPQNDLPTISVSGKKENTIEKITLENHLPKFLTIWQDKVVTVFRRGTRNYHLGIYSKDGKLIGNHRIEIDKIIDVTSKCSDRLYILSKKEAIIFEFRQNTIYPVEKLALDDYYRLFSNCRSKSEKNFIFEQQALNGLIKNFFLYKYEEPPLLLKAYNDSLASENYIRDKMLITSWGNILNMGEISHVENEILRNFQEDAHMFETLLYTDDTQNFIFYNKEDIVLFNFNEALIEQF